MEHYGLDISDSTVRRITEGHGAQIQDHPGILQGKPNKAGSTAAQLIAETDGTMVPMVTIDSSFEGDQRKTRKVAWKEVRLALVYEPGTVDPVFGTTTGGVDQTGDQLACCASAIGMDEQTDIHGVGDGACWISNQMERVFGAQGSYLIDFYHLCDYLAAASKSCAADHQAWLRTQKARMKAGQKDVVLAILEVHLEPASVEDKDAPVRACLRYIRNRPDQFDYPEAIRKKLPIGSGKIESGHRYVIQERMKIPGAWWKIENVDSMLALRTMRANGLWGDYWDTYAKQDKFPSL